MIIEIIIECKSTRSCYYEQRSEDEAVVMLTELVNITTLIVIMNVV